MGTYSSGVNYGAVGWVKRNSLRWFGQVERKKSAEIVEEVHLSESVNPNNRGRPLGRWKDKLKEYKC